MGDSNPAGIAVTVTPSQAAYFAGEEFQVTITFTNLNELVPSTSYAHYFAQGSNPPPAPPSSLSSQSEFSAGHRRGAHSVVAFPPNISYTPRTASSRISSAAVPDDDSVLASRDESYLPHPKPKSLIGKGKRRGDVGSVDSSPSMPSATPPNGISQFKRKHAPRSLSVSGDVYGAPRTPLSKLDFGPLDSSPECEVCFT